MLRLLAIFLVITMVPVAWLHAEDPTIPGTYQDLVNTRQGWLSDVRFTLFNVWPGEYEKPESNGIIPLTFVARFASGFGSAVKLDVQRVYVGADGTQHFILRPLRIPNDAIVVGGSEKNYDSLVTVKVPVGLNGPTVYLHAVEADSITTKAVQLPVPKLN